MKVHFIRSGERRYGMRIERASGPALVMDPAPGFDADLPHDMVHLVVEAALGLKGGLFGQLAAGGDGGTFHVEVTGGKAAAKDRRRTARRTAAQGQKLANDQGRDGELSELAAFCFDIEWRRRSRPDSAAQRAALGEADRTRQSLSIDERARFDAATPRIFDAFVELSAAWRTLRVGEALTLEWPSLRRANPGQPIG